MRNALRRLALPAAVVLVCLLAAVPAFAQNQASHEDNGIGIGVNFGFTNTHASDNLNESYASNTGSLFGLWVGGNENGLIGFTGEFNYLQTGYTPQGASEVTQKVFEIPAVFHVNVGSRSRNGIHAIVILGPVFDIVLKTSITNVSVNNYDGANIGIMGGGGIEAYRVGVQLRGDWGLRNVGNTGGVADVKTFQFQVVGTFRFN